MLLFLFYAACKPKHYLNVLKGRLKDEENQSVTNCRQLKLMSSDGKYYNTDIEGMFRLIESKIGKKIVTSSNNKNIKQITNK